MTATPASGANVELRCSRCGEETIHAFGGRRWVCEVCGCERPPDGRVERRPLSAVRPRVVHWLVPGLIPLGTLTLCAGVGGLGKSTWLAGVAARATTGELLGDAADAILISFEDTAAEILRPRVEAANGDLDRVHEVYVPLDQDGPLTLPRDLDDLAAHVAETNAKLVAVDPIIAAIGVEFDAHKDQHVRHVLAELTTLAEDTGCAVVMVGHLNKTQSIDAYVRIANSVAFYNAARSVVLITADSQEPEQHRFVSQVKANWSRLRPVQRHVLEEIQLDAQDGGERIVSVRMRYLEDADEIDRGDLLAGRRDRNGADNMLSTAVRFLDQTLSDGDWHDSAGLKILAGAQGISESTLKRAAQALDVEHERRGYPSSTWWRLPQSGHTFTQSEGPTGEAA